MSIARLRVLAIAVALAGSGVAISLLHARTSDWKVGDVFVAIGNGKYEVRDNTGAPKETITIGLGLDPEETAGCWFDSQFNLYTADPANTKVIRHQLASPHDQDIFAHTNTEANNGHSNSIVMAVNGDVLVGNPGGGGPAKSILRYRSDKVFKAKYQPATENGGIDWMDLATDQRTMFYTSRGRKIMKFKLANTTGQLPDFATLPGNTPANTAYAIRLLPPFNLNTNGQPIGGLLVADNAVIRQLDASGTTIATWDIDHQGTQNDENAWRALNLDPDGVHFWAFGVATGRLFKFSLNNPGDPNPGDNIPGTNTQVLGPIQTAGDGTSAGLCVMGEAQLQVQPLQLSTGSGSTPVLKDVTASFGDPTATSPTSFYSFSTWRLRIHVAPSQPILAAVSFTPQITDLECTTGNETTDFDCRFPDPGPPVPGSPLTQCVPFFRDPSADDAGDVNEYRCAYYRVKDMPPCTATSVNGTITNCTAPFAEPLVPLSNDVQGEIVMNLTNPPTSLFPVSFFGPEPKGNPRLMRDPDSVSTGPLAKKFFIDATTAVIDWPAFGTGTPNDYSPVQRRTDTSQTPGPGQFQGCVDIIGPNGNHANGGSVLKIVIEVKDGIRGSNGLCTGNPLPGALTPPNNITIAISNQAQNFLDIFCATPGNSLGCLTPVPGQTARFQTTFDLVNPPFVPDTTNPYIFAVTSVNVPSASQDPNAQGSGLFPPVCKKIWVCPTGNNCIPAGANPACQ